MKLYKTYIIAALIIFGFIFQGCRKYVSIPNPTDQLTDGSVFSNESTANEAISGIYQSLRDNVFYSPTPTILTGLSADELRDYFSDPAFDEFQKNAITVSNSYNLQMWSGLFNVVYQANAAIEGLSASALISSTKNQLLGEAKFLRAFAYFYLVNLYGEVPLFTTTDINKTATAARSSVDTINAQIINDLKDAESEMASTNSFAGGENIRANSWCAQALLARVYLYSKDWSDAQLQSTDIIASGNYALETNLNNVFTKNNTESILQLANNSSDYVYEANYFIPSPDPYIICTTSFVNAFATGDLRKTNWLQSGAYISDSFYSPFKYQYTSSGSGEYYTLMRLAEQYLIRAEANANQKNTSAALDDINTIRHRAGLSDISGNISSDSCLLLILHERQCELFAECGHRWFDLKRTGNLDILNTEKTSPWNPGAALYPIPFPDLQKDNNLSQNAGY
jgi:starch-binding outer membrane protein, SusD/RagB family